MAFTFPLTFTSALKTTTAAIKSNKLIFIVLLLIQIIFFISLFTINAKYQLAITGNMESITAAIEQANYDDSTIRQGTPFIANTATIYESYQSIVSNIKKLIIYQLVAFLTLNILAWSITHNLFKKQSISNFFKLLLSLFLRSLAFLIPMFILIYFILNNAITQALAGDEQIATAAVYSSILVFIIFFYFMIVSFSLDFPLNKTLECIKTAYLTGIKKIHYLIPALLAIIITITLIVSILYISSLPESQWTIIPMLLFAFLFVASFVIARIFFMAFVWQIKTQQ